MAWVVAKLIPLKLATTIAICVHGGVGGAASVEDLVCTPVLRLQGAMCYDPASSLRKRNDVQGKGWLDFSSLNLTSRSAWFDTKDNVSGAGSGDSKG